MFNLLFIVSIIGMIVQIIKEATRPTIPVENWANKDLYYKDIADGVPIEERMKNLENGKYKTENTYPEPHRDPVSGKIIIENDTLYQADLKAYGGHQTMQWARQGKYNLTTEEFKKEKERIESRYNYLYKL